MGACEEASAANFGWRRIEEGGEVSSCSQSLLARFVGILRAGSRAYLKLEVILRENVLR